MFYDCDYLYWNASSVYYALVDGHCDHGSYCGSLALALDFVTSAAGWWIGASLKYFYDCDYLWWAAFDICYALVGAAGGTGAVCGFTTMHLNAAASGTVWDIGAF